MIRAMHIVPRLLPKAAGILAIAVLGWRCAEFLAPNATVLVSIGPASADTNAAEGGHRTGPPQLKAQMRAQSQPELQSPPALAGVDQPSLDAMVDGVLRSVSAQETNFEHSADLKSSGPAALNVATAANEIPRARRWEIYFRDEITVAEYARQLDYFGIELGTTGGPGELVYASNLSKPTPDKRAGPRESEQRLYMSWRQGQLAEADRRLMVAAGADVAGKVVVLFLPPAVEEQLALAEQQFAGRNATAILKTRFRVRRVGDAYEFFVTDQTPLH